MTRYTISMVGVSHRTAHLAERERFAFSPLVRRRLLAESGVGLMVVTCNRTELYGPGDGAELERRLLSAARGERNGLFVHRGEAAARHLFAVAAGLDSMVLGEPQILGQVKRAMAEAREVGALDGVLDELVRRALTVGRRVRRETDLGRGLPSIPKVATGMARLILGGLAGRRMLLVGTGKLGDLTARTLKGAGATAVAVTNRTPASAEELAQRIGARAEPFEELDRLLAEADIVLTCTAAESPFLTRERVARAMAMRASHARDRLVIIDIAVPRDVSANVRELPGVRLCDLDDLREWGSEAISPETVEAARAIVDHEARDFTAWQAGLSAVPTIRALQTRVEQILAAEIDRAVAGDPDALRLFGRRLLNKLLHHPMRRLRDGAASGDERTLELARELFGLERDGQLGTDGQKGVDDGCA